MQTLDAESFSRLLVETCECYGQKPLTPGAQKRWFEVLRNIPIERVQAGFKIHLRSRARMPAPSDILQICESLAARATDWPTTEQAPSAPPPATERGRQCRETIKRFMERDFRPPSKRWAKDIVLAAESGSVLQYYDPMDDCLRPLTDRPIPAWQVRFARKALEQPRHPFAHTRRAEPERIPGEDDE
jgi:hypothetical protein